MSDEIIGRVVSLPDAEIKQLNRITELEAAIREYLGEYDTPAKDYAYRAACRAKLRKLVEG